MDGTPNRTTGTAASPAPEPDDSDLYRYLTILWRRRWTIVVTVVAAVVVAGAYTFARPVRYQAAAVVQLQPQIPQALLQATSGLLEAQVNVPTEVDVIESQAVASIARRSVPAAPPVSATEVGATEEVAVSVDAATPQLAAQAANAYVAAYLTFQRQQTAAELTAAAAALQERLASVQRLMAADQQELTQPSLGSTAASGIDNAVGDLQYQAGQLSDKIATYRYLASSPAGESGRVVSAATPPPAKVSSTRPLVLGAAAGVVLGVALALLRESFARDAAVTAAAAHRDGAHRHGPGRPLVAMPPVPDLERASGQP